MADEEAGSLAYHLYRRRHLPHYQPGGATLFETICLAGSMPADVIEMMQKAKERAQRLAESESLDSAQKKRQYEEQKRLFARWDRAMDRARHGPLWLRDPRVAGQVIESMDFLDGRMYDLACFCVMPNHVHLVFTPLLRSETEYYSLSRILHSLKGFTAKQANALLEREGPFWHDEGYDHAIRNGGEFERIVAYVLNNPVKAGLVSRWRDWPWSMVKGLDRQESVVVGFQ